MNTSQETNPVTTLCSIDEVAAACFVSTQTIRNWMERGIMPQPIRIGRRCLRWKADEINSWLESQQGTRKEAQLV